MIGTHQPVTLLHIENLINLSGKHQTVATQNRLVINGGSKHLIVMDDFYQMATGYIGQPCLGDGLADVWVVGWHQQFYGKVARRFEGRL